MTERMRSQVQASEMRFLRGIQGYTAYNLTRCAALRFENLLTSRRYFSKSKDRSLDGFTM